MGKRSRFCYLKPRSREQILATKLSWELNTIVGASRHRSLVEKIGPPPLAYHNEVDRVDRTSAVSLDYVHFSILISSDG